MTFAASVLYAQRLMFPKTQKTSSARRSLRGALLCIGISLVPLVAVLTISNGMIEGITSRIIGLSSSHLLVEVPYYSKEARSADSLNSYAGQIANFDEITAAFPEIQGTALAAGKNGRTGAAIRGVDFSMFTKNTSFHNLLRVVSGSIPEDGTGRLAVIGQKIADTLGIKVGDGIRLITTGILPNGAIVPKVTICKVVATVSCGYDELDSLWVFIPLSEGMRILPLNSSSIDIMLETADAFSKKLPEIQSTVASLLGGDSVIYRWDELNAAEYENFASTKMLLLFIMLLIVLVASVNVASALVMLVMERRREIAILKSLGGTSGGITFSFLLTGLITGIGGVLFGIPLGLLFAVNINKIIQLTEKTVNIIAEFVYLLKSGSESGFVWIHLLDPAYYLQDIPVSIPIRELFLIGTGTLVLSLIVSAIPAVKAGKEKPLDTLRKT